jgi:hypothetical protein
VCLVVAPSAEAHGLSGRTDLPIPTWLFGWAAAIVLVVSFAALATLWPKPRLQEPTRRRLLTIPAAVDVACGTVGLLFFALVVYSGLAGTEQTNANLAPTFIYVHFWVGLVVLSVLFGDVFRAFNPWLALARGASWASARVLGRSPIEGRPYPDWLGRWPAAIGILGFAWLELAYVNKDDPDILAILALAYAAVQLAGMAVFGIAAWSRHGDAFGAYFNLFASLSVFERIERTLFLRPPLSGAPRLPMVAGGVALLVVAIGSTTFDGFSNGSVWADLSPDIQELFTDLGASQRMAVQWASTVGLLGCVLAIGAFYRLGIEGMRTVGGGHDSGELARSFAHTLAPIAFAYALAHYFSLLLFQGQAGAYLISDPLGKGWDIFGTANATIDYTIISGNAIWYVQVGALIGPRDATRSQYWMLVVMVGFTSLGLWLLSAVNQ